MKKHILLSMVLFSFIAACSGGGGPSDGGDDGSDELVGAFQVDLVAPASGNPGYTQVFGKVFNGPTPSPLVWELTSQDGACRLVAPRVPHCETPCGGTAICVEDNQCQEYPTAIGVGTMHVKGLQTTAGGDEFSMDPIANNYQPVGVTLEYPAFSEGDDITFTADGASPVPGFALAAKGISQLEILNQSISLDDGQAVTLSWNAPAQSGVSTIFVKLDISHHGGTKGMIECDTADTGSLQLKAAMLDRLKALGVSGFPTIVVTRKAVGSAKIPYGRVDLVVGSTLEKEVLIPGLVSCNEDGDCPAGQTCQTDLKCK